MKPIYISTLWLLVALPARGQIQDTAVANRLLEEAVRITNKKEYAEALLKLDSAAAIYARTVGRNSLDYSTCLRVKGLVYSFRNDENTAIAIFRESIAIREILPDPPDADLANTFNYLAKCYFAKGDYERAEKYYRKGLDLRITLFGEESPEAARSYNDLGYLFNQRSEYDRAIEYHKKALEIRSKMPDPLTSNIDFSHYNLGIGYSNRGLYDKALEHYRQALDVRLRRYGPASMYVSGVYDGMGRCYLKMGKHAEALEWLRKSMETALAVVDSSHSVMAYCYTALGSYYNTVGDLGEARRYFTKSLNINLRDCGERHPDVAVAYFRLGLCHTGDEALEFYRKALDANNYVPGRPEQAFSPVTLLNTLIKTAETFRLRFVQQHDAKDLYAAHAAGRAARAVVYAQRRAGHAADGNFAPLARLACDGALTADLLLYRHTDSIGYLQEAFACAEEGRAFSLVESFREAHALRFAGIPDSLLQKERDLRADITYFDKKHFEQEIERKKPPTDSTLLAIDGQLFNLKRAYEDLKNVFETRYPAYYQLKYDLHTQSIRPLQEDLLQPDQALLEYAITDSSIFIFLIKKTDSRVVEVRKDFPLGNWVERLRFGLYGFFSAPPDERTAALRDSAQTAYLEAGRALYDKLLAPVAEGLPQRLLVVPDGLLGYLPFETLLSQAPADPARYESYPYVGRERSLGYCYSGTLFSEMTARRHLRPAPEPFLAYAPFFYEDTTLIASRGAGTRRPAKHLPMLRHTAEEVTGLQRLLGGKAVIGAGATRRAFVAEAGRYRILHLSTHGKANDQAGDYSFLAFAENADSVPGPLLYVRDVYNLSLQADLVTLSACETGVGELKRGEGIISLARAFAYAGAKSIVTTLWPVDDAKTKVFMFSFYKNLKKGLTKDRALAAARLEYLGRYRGLDAHPFFWAGVIGIGDMRQIFGR